MAKTRTSFRHALIGSTALIGTAILFGVAVTSAAQAATISTTTTTPVTLNAGDPTLTVTDTGTLTTTGAPAVTVSGAATSIAIQADIPNSKIGQISTGSGQTAILVTGAGSTLSSGITVDGVLQAAGNVIQVANGGTIAGNIINNNYVIPITSSNAAAVLVTGAGSDISGQFINNANHGVKSSTNAAFDIENGGHMSGGLYLNANSHVTGGNASTGAAIIVNGSGSDIGGGIHNTGGAIEGLNSAIVVTSGGNISGGIHNTGSIISTSSHTKALISVSGTSSNISGGITNSGTIAGNTIGISVASSGQISGGIVNSAGGTLSGTHHAIMAISASMAGGITNSGKITSNTSQAIYLRTAHVTGDITNNAGGTISSSSSSAITLWTTSTLTGNITNNGVITASASHGISVGTQSVITGKIINGGTIAGHTGIYFSSGATAAGITNTGTITGSGGGLAISISGNSVINGEVLNDTGGKISATETAIGLKSSSVTGSITNRGIITSSSQNGLLINSTSIISGNIDNFGTISGNAEAIKLATSGTVSGSIINESSGIIMSSGAVSAVTIDNSTLNGSFVNAGGTISAQQNSLLLNTATVGGVIDNTGLLKSTASGSNISVQASSIHAITNEAAGRMQSQASNISMDGTSTVTGDITNAGVMTSPTTSISVKNTTINGAINNNAGGTISGTANGIELATGASMTGQLVNSGKIISTSGKAFSAKAGAALFSINNASGTISGQTGISFASNAHMSGSIANTGLIKGTVTGIAIGSGMTPNQILINNAGGTVEGGAGGAIHINDATHGHTITINGGSIIGNVVDDNATLPTVSTVQIKGNFTTNGNFTVSDFSVDSGKSLTVTAGNVINSNHSLSLSGATVNIGLNSSTTFGSFVTASNAALTGTTFTVVSAASPTLTNGASLKIIDGAAPLTGGPGGTLVTVTDNSALWNFSIVDGTYNSLSNADDLYLIVSSAPTTSCTSSPNTAGNASACQTLQANASTTDPKLQQLISNMNAASTTQQLNNVLSSTQAGVNGAGVQQSIDVANGALDLNGERMALLSGGGAGMASGNGVADEMKGKNAWAQSFGQYAHQGERGNIGGYVARTLGLAAGIDSGTNLDGKIIGFAFSYAHTNADSRNANTTDTDIDSYQLSAYGNYDLPHDSYVRGMAALTWSETDTARHDVGGVAGLTANGDFSARQFTLRGEAGRDFAYKDAVVTPKFTGRWTFYDADSYTETGAGGANLHVNYKNMNILEVGPAVSARWKHKYADGSTLVPQLSLGYSYDLVGDNIEASSAFTGGTGTIASVGPTPARGRLTFDAKATLYTANNWNLTAAYDLNYKADYVSHAGFLRAGYKF